VPFGGGQGTAGNGKCSSSGGGPGSLTACDDYYAVLQDTTLTVPTLGVLENDDPNEPGITAVQVGEPTAHGQLTFHADGSFVYVPVAQFVGGDSFTYFYCAT
jgi:hypothetical protein